MEYYNIEKLKADLKANYGRVYQQCSLSVMDTIADPDITFDEKGISNYYYDYLNAEKQGIVKGDVGEKTLINKINEIKKHGKNKEYDCIIGLSGGVDSTYLCLLAKNMGLRPLIVHFDNGWNSELAVFNIENVINKLSYDLYTYVVDWEEFKDLQLSYIKASVVDIEVLTDQAFMAVLYEQARKWKIKYVVAGMNIATESVLPSNWIYWKGDTTNIRDIQKKHGKISLSNIKSYPFLKYETKRYCRDILKMEVVTPLNYINYRYDEVKKEITDKLGWQDYGGKHYESVWTRFYQGYLLPYKFNIDKRKAHYSNLIFSGQMTKTEALEKLQHPTYDKKLLQEDFEFVLKKFGLTKEEFEYYMKQPRKEHTEYKTQKGISEKYPLLKPFLRLLKASKG